MYYYVTKRSPYTLYPDSKFRFIWDFVSCMLIIHQCLIIPLIYAFDDFDPSYLQRADPIFELWFMFDVFLNFNTGFYLKGVVIMERDMIVKQYLKSWFLIDFISFMPYSIIITNLKINPLSMIRIYFLNLFLQDPQTQYTIRLGISVLENLRLLRLFRFVKLDKLMIHAQDQISSDLTNSIFRFAKLMMLIHFTAHWLACLFYTVAASLYGKSNNWIINLPLKFLLLTSFIYMSQNYALKSISDAQLNDASMGERYVNALYWAITTMATVGYGDIKIKTTEERLVVICIMYISGAIYAFIINNNNNVITLRSLRGPPINNMFNIYKGLALYKFQ